jgi:hypothetical protein
VTAQVRTSPVVSRDGPADPSPAGTAGPQTRRPGRFRPLLVAAPRTAVLLGVAGLAAVTVVAGQVWRPAPASVPPPPALPLTASSAVPVCPGPQTLQAPDGAKAVAANGPTVVGAVVAPPGLLGPDGTLGPDGADRAAQARLSPMVRGQQGRPAEGGYAVTAAVGRAGVLRATVRDGADAPASGAGPLRLDGARDGTLPVLGATQVTFARTGDLRGLSAVSCGVASTDAWLLGGGTQVGRRARLLLANPAPAAAVVDLTVLGPAGEVGAPSGEGIVVPAGGQVPVLLDALAPGLDALAVHVVARSGRVAATLDDEVVRGLVPGGTDGVTASAEPSTRQVVPGLSVNAGSASQDAAAAGAAAVRVAVPGPADAVVRVRLLGPDGPQDLPGVVRTVTAGTVVDLPLTGIPTGLYTAVVEADAPVVAAGLVGRTVRPRSTRDAAGVPRVLPGDNQVADLAWSASSAGLQGVLAVAAPALDGVKAVLALGAVDSTRVVVVPLSADGAPGAPRTFDLAAGTTGSLTLPGGSAGALVRTLTGTVHPALVLGASDPKGTMVAAAAVRPGSVAATTGRAPVVVADPAPGMP